ncbi:2OG-Fe(II) oxygenase family protein [Hyphomonas sp.]|uniref:2OG-Fe(II) oxygenase n=1 Tax=Hyphomonas sp. TaxID=87 RepID=UPI0025BF7C89|nr:2OG-Fe(II) oxygenase family protein [Hyphomonas sp.]MBI1398812.1 proline hydroxylase [Hyphomonas sp.]
MTPELKLNPELDVAALAREFAIDGKIRVRDLLTLESADALARCLETETEYSIAAVDGNSKPVILPGSEINWASPAIRVAVERGRSGFSFLYKSNPMYGNYLVGKNPEHTLHAATAFINSAPFLDFIRTLTGCSDVTRADAQAARYEPGCYLTSHTDRVPGERRRAAYVLGLTRRWHPDWGGLLLFTDMQGQVTDAYAPGFNTLDVFRTPRPHSVTPVTPFASGVRQSITGWARAAEDAED